MKVADLKIGISSPLASDQNPPKQNKLRSNPRSNDRGISRRRINLPNPFRDSDSDDSYDFDGDDGDPDYLDMVRLYKRDVRRIPRLTPDEEKKLDKDIIRGVR